MRVVLEVDKTKLEQLNSYLEQMTDNGVVEEYYYNKNGQATLFDFLDIKYELADLLEDGNQMDEEKLNTMATDVLDTLWEDEEYQDNFGEITIAKIREIVKGAE